MKTLIAAVQMVSTPDVDDNLNTAKHLIGEAASKGAKLVLLPEFWPLMGNKDTDKLAYAETPGKGPIQSFLSDMAQKHKIWLIGGTIPLKATEPDKVMNTVLVMNPEGKCAARYDKIHLFRFNKNHEAYDESATLVPGNEPCAAETPYGRIGLSVCYDLRFPELYRALGTCSLLVVPAAFTYTTGQAHWEILLRARAIENQCYVLASAQGGTHVNGRRTWGHSMLIDPWGNIVDQLKEGEGVVLGEIDSERLEDVRSSLPALQHRRL